VECFLWLPKRRYLSKILHIEKSFLYRICSSFKLLRSTYSYTLTKVLKPSPRFVLNRLPKVREVVQMHTGKNTVLKSSTFARVTKPHFYWVLSSVPLDFLLTHLIVGPFCSLPSSCHFQLHKLHSKVDRGISSGSA